MPDSALSKHTAGKGLHEKLNRADAVLCLDKLIITRMPKSKSTFRNEVLAVEGRGELRQIKTMVDGTVNVTVNIPEDCREQVKAMMDWMGNELHFVFENHGIGL